MLNAEMEKTRERIEFSAEYLIEYLNMLIEWYEDPSTPQEFIANAQEKAQQILAYVPDAQLVVGSGYPHYVIGASNTQVPEFTRFFRSVINEIERKATNGKIVLSNKSSDHSLSFKQLLRILPDLDLFVIVDQIGDESKTKLQDLTHSWNEADPDQSPQRALAEFYNYLLLRKQARDSGNPSPPQKPPIRADLLIAERLVFDNAYQAIGRGDLAGSTVLVQALHGQWEEYQDVLAEDLLTARSSPPLAVRSNSERVFAGWKKELTRFACRFASTQALLETWKHFLLQRTNGKNWRIVSSSPELLLEAVRRAEQLLHPSEELLDERALVRTYQEDGIEVSDAALAFTELIAHSDMVFIMTHPHPDPDAIGSTVALNLVCKSLGKPSQIVVFEEVPETLSWILPENFSVLSADEYHQVIAHYSQPLTIVADIGETGRIQGYWNAAIENGRNAVVIDHHSGDSGVNTDGNVLTVNYENLTSNTELVWLLTRELIQNPIPSYYTALLMGIFGDTDARQRFDVPKRVDALIAKLKELGADENAVIANLARNKNFETMRLTWRLLADQIKHKHGLTWLVISNELLQQLKESGVVVDAGSLAEEIRNISGTVISCVCVEHTPQRWQLSLRSGNTEMSVGKIATDFGGGGHHDAAAFRNIENIEIVLEEIKEKAAAFVASQTQYHS